MQLSCLSVREDAPNAHQLITATLLIFISICCSDDGKREDLLVELQARLATKPPFGWLNWASPSGTAGAGRKVRSPRTNWWGTG